MDSTNEMATTPPTKMATTPPPITSVEEADCAMHLIAAGEQFLDIGEIDGWPMEGQKAAHEALRQAARQLSTLADTFTSAERHLLLARSNLRFEQAALVHQMMCEALSLAELEAAEAELRVSELRQILYPKAG